MRKRATLVQFFGSQGLMVLAIIQGIVFFPLYLQHIDATQYGQWLAIGSTVSMLGLIDLGVTSLIIQKSGFYYGKGDVKSLGAFLGTTFIFVSVIAVVILVIGLWLSYWVPQWIGVKGLEIGVFQAAFQYATFDVVLMLIVSMSGSMLVGIQKPGPHLAGLTLGTILSIAVTVTLIYHNWGILALACGSIARPIISIAFNSVALLTHLRKILKSAKLKIDRPTLKLFFVSAFWLGPAKLAEAMTMQVDSLIVVKILQPLDATILYVTRKAGEMTVQIIGRISASFLAGLSHLKGEGSNEKIRTVVADLFLVSGYSAGGMLCGVLILNASFVSLWVGGNLYAGLVLTLLICIYCMLKIIRIVTYNVVMSNGNFQISSASSIVEALAQAGLGIVLCKFLGLNGVVIAAIVAVILGGSIQFYCLYKTHNMNVCTIVKQAFKLSICILMTLLIGYISYKFIAPNSWVYLFIFAIYIIIIYSLVVFLIEKKFRLKLAKYLIGINY